MQGEFAGSLRAVGASALRGAVQYVRQAPPLEVQNRADVRCAYSDWCDWGNEGHNDWEDQSGGTPPGG
jgi:hypothetical protein